MDTSETEDIFVSLKNKGNEEFKLKNYDKAISYYTEAIASKGDEAVAHTNRALCYINLKKYLEAKDDCDKALSLDPTSVKAYYRRATVMKELLRFEQAIEDLKKVSSLDPNFTLATRELEDLQNVIREDKRIELEPMDKPQEFRSKNPVKTFNLNKHFYGTKTYGDPYNTG